MSTVKGHEQARKSIVRPYLVDVNSDVVWCDPARLKTAQFPPTLSSLQDNYMKGQAAVNTTRDYIRAAVFFANTAILLTTFTVGYAGRSAFTPWSSRWPSDRYCISMWKLAR